MQGDVLEYVAACPNCVEGKSSDHASAGLLNLLPIP